MNYFHPLEHNFYTPLNIFWKLKFWKGYLEVQISAGVHFFTIHFRGRPGQKVFAAMTSSERCIFGTFCYFSTLLAHFEWDFATVAEKYYSTGGLILQNRENLDPKN